MKHLIILLAALAMLALASACSKDTAPKSASAEVVATVNGHEITRAVFDAYAIAHTEHPTKDLGATQKAKVLDDLIEMVLIADAPGTEDPAAKAVLDAQVELTRLSLKAQRKVEDALKAGPTEAELKAEYDSQVKLMASQSEYLTRHIVADSQDKANGIIRDLKGGADFAKLARKYAVDAESQDGVVIWVDARPDHKVFADAMRSLKKGEVTPVPVQSPYGWHVIRLEDTRTATPPDFEAAKVQITDGLQRKRIQSLIENLKKTAKTEKRI